MRPHLIVLALALALVPQIAMANDDGGNLDIPSIRSHQAALQAQVRSGSGAFQDMDEVDRKVLVGQQDRLLALIQDKQSAQELSQDAQAEVSALLDQIQQQIANAEDGRKVCTRVKTLGSNRMQTVCRTAKQVREERERARAELERPSSH